MIRYTFDTAIEEASRCLMCADAPCHKGCPASVDSRIFIRKIRFDDLRGAARFIRRSNVLAGSCAYLCPCLSMCGAECTSSKLSRPIDIVGLQRFVMERERENVKNSPSPRPSPQRGEGEATPLPFGERPGEGGGVAIVGSGPAGLSAAASLALLGYRVEVFEREKVLGGQLRLSIPAFRLPPEMLDYEIDLIKKMGVKFHMGKEIRNPFDLKSKGFDAVFFSPGLMASKKLGIAGEDKNGVLDALDFLIRSKRGDKIKIGKKVLVIGGGDTAIDAARVAARAGAQILMLYRRTQKEMPAYRPDIDEAWSEGVEFWFRVVPVEVIGDKHVTGLKVRRVNWKGSGRKAKEYDIEGPEFEIKADMVINAVGQAVESDFDFDVGKSGGVKLGLETQMVSDGIFVGGDFAYGGTTAVAAVGSGQRAASEIHEYCSPSPQPSPQRGEGAAASSAPRGEGAAASSVPRGEGAAASSVPRGEGAAIPLPVGEGPGEGEYENLAITFCGVEFENPFVLAAAPPSDELDMVRNAFKAGWAGAVLKTTSVEGTAVDLKYPMMSSIDCESSRVAALGNIDLISEYHIDVVKDRVRKLKKEFPSKVVIASIMGSKKEEWQSLVSRLSDAGVDMIECSFSCPQGSLGAKPGQMLAQNVALTKTVAGWVKDAAKAHPRNVPVVIKITPHVTDICEVAQAVKDAGADAVCASNTIQSLMGINLETWVPNPNVEGKSTYSGMSGPAIKPITLKVISEIARKVGIPITGTGGPVTWKDAIEFMLAGATTVQFCTAVMHYGYDIIDDLKEAVSDYLRRKGLKSVSELVGRALPNIVSHEELTYKKEVISKIDHDKCIRDDLCYIACRDGGHMAISVDDERKPTVDEDKCVGCGLCRLICPVKGCIEIG